MKTDIKKLIRKDLEEKLEDIFHDKPVACQHLMELGEKYFCAASCDVDNGQKCIYKVENQYDPGTTETSPFYVNHCYQLRPDDLKLILLSRHNHLFPLNGHNKNKKLTEFDENE